MVNLDQDTKGALLRAAKIRYDLLSQALQLVDTDIGRGAILRELTYLEQGIVELERNEGASWLSK